MAKPKNIYPHVMMAEKYARDVLAGEIPACKYVKLACQRHLDDLEKQKDPAYPYRFDPAKGQRKCTFSEMMIHIKGKWARQTIKLEPWQAFCYVVPFGWVRKSDGLRRFREMYLEIPRKNTKSTMGAITGNYMFAADGEPGAEVYSGATTEYQAWEVFRPAMIMTKWNPDYKEYYGISDGAKVLNIMENASKFMPVIGSPGDGASPSCAIIDEYHEHKTSDLYDTMTTGMGARQQPMTVIITTAGTDLAGPCKQKHDYVIQVLEGVFENEELFGVIYGIDEDDDWTDFNSWIKANPNFGVSVFEDYLRKQHRDATQIASRQNMLRCKHLNQWLSADVAWMNILEWKACTSDISLDDFEGMPCWIGLDLASKVDIAALMMIFRKERDYYVFGRYYLPEDTIDRPENQHYQAWRLMDKIIETPGNVIDYEYIKDDLRIFKSRFEIKSVGYDPFQATQLSTELLAEGFPMVEVGATVKNFSEPMKETEKLVLQRHFHHDGDPVLTWMMSNVVGHYDKKDNIFPNKQRSENKIDGPVGIFIAMNRALVFDGKKQSKYEKEGLVVL